MPDSDNYPVWVSEICKRVAARLAAIKGIRAVALGGSRARGTAREDSDIDLGLYYDQVRCSAWKALCPQNLTQT
jgi:predicted nucleotidyltransferase